MRMSSFGLSERVERATNDDSFVASSELGLYAVADGIGARPGAGTASRRALESLVHRVQALRSAGPLHPGAIKEALEAVNADVMAEADREPGLSGLGTTLSALLFDGVVGAWVVHLGDSRLFVLHHGRLRCLTVDHTVAQELVRLRRLRADQVEGHPLRHMLSRFVGSPVDAEPDVGYAEVAGGDCFVLATDGLTRALPEPEIQRLCVEHGPSGAEATCRALVEEALRRSPPDNVTAVVVQVGHFSTGPFPPDLPSLHA